MPIGTSKSGLLGAGVVPGGCEVFNAPGCFVVPTGVTLISSVCGSGAAGNPGNPGNPGGIGIGGAGGAGGTASSVGLPSPTVSAPTNAARVGYTAGPPGNPGNCGNTGAASSVFCLTFPGGCGGTAGSAGNKGSNANNGAAGISDNSVQIVPCYYPNSPCANRTTNVLGGTLGGGRSGRGRWYYISCTCTGIKQIFSAAGSGGGGSGDTNGANAVSNNLAPMLNQAQRSGGTTGGGTGAAGSYTYGSTPGGNNNALSRAAIPGKNANPGSVFGAGGGGGGGQSRFGGPNTANMGLSAGGGGGGGGRGCAGNPGTCGNAGACATPTTFNCVAVVSGATYPVTANGPVTITWCPQ